MNATDWRRLAVGGLLLAVGMVMGSALNSPNEARGQNRGATPPPTAFQSGGQMSVPLLKEIAGTLHQIDGRLERLEAVAMKSQLSQTGQK
jgi:hypothetical protein